MLLDIGCTCGNMLTVDSAHAGQPVSCPACGRTHVVPEVLVELPARSSSSRSPSSRAWIPVAASVVAILLLGATLWWALLTPGGGAGGGDVPGDNPWAGRMNRGSGSGTGADGDGAGGGGTGADSGEGESPSTQLGQPGTPRESETQPGPATRPVEPEGPVEPERPLPPPSKSIAGLDTTPRPAPPVRPAPEPGPDSGEVGTGRTGGGAPAGKAGPYGQRGNSDFARKMGATPESEAAVDLGLAWLARVQKEDGHWVYDGTLGISSRRKTPFTDGSGRYDLGVTGLATLAFLGAGHTHRGKSKYAATVRRALDWIVRRQDALGDLRWESFYSQGAAATALCEAYGMTKDVRLRRPAQKALDYILLKVGPNGGYGYDGAGNDTHVVSFQVMAMKSGKLAGLSVVDSIFPLFLKYYDQALGPDGTTGYSSGARGSGAATSARTALGLFCRLFLGCGVKNETCQRIATILHRVGPQTNDVFQTYYGTYSMFQMGGKTWGTWNGKFRDKVIALQVKTGTDRGSWACRDWHGGGRVCTTAVYIMALEVYYRYLPINK